jgi:hypothetical protein
VLAVILAAAAFVQAPAAASPAQGQTAVANVTGAWDLVISVPDAPLSLYAEWTQKENVVDGSVFDAQDETKVSGTMEGNVLKINLYISGVVIRLTGEVKGDTITGKASHASAGQVDWTATRAKQQ